MGNRALSVLATAAILATASNGWGQDARGAPDAGAVFDAAPGDDGGGATVEEDAGPPPVDFDASGEDAGGGSSANDGAPASPGNPFGAGNPFGNGNPFDASYPFGPGDPFDSGYDPFDSSDPFGFAELDAGPFEPPGVPGGGTDPGAATATGPTDTPVSDTAATDDASTTAGDDSSGSGGAQVLAWGDAAPPAREIESPSNVAAPVIGCGGCSTSDSSAQGAMALAFAAVAVAWRCRRSKRAPGTKGG